jgi:hypothetical protein
MTSPALRRAFSFMAGWDENASVGSTHWQDSQCAQPSGCPKGEAHGCAECYPTPSATNEKPALRRVFRLWLRGMRIHERGFDTLAQAKVPVRVGFSNRERTERRIRPEAALV